MGTSLRRNVRAPGRGSAARRDQDAAGLRVAALFDEFAPMVLAICRCNLRDPQAAEDAAQETFLSAHRSMLRGTRPRDPAAWLATIARNNCRRTGRTAREAPLDEQTPGPLDPADIVAERAELSNIARAISELPARQREALVLREFCGLSYEQVAAAMSVSGTAVDSLLSRARRRLVEQFGEGARTLQGTLVVPASLREDLARLIPGLDAAGTAAGVGVGGAAIASLGSAPVTAKIAATGAAAVALALPVQATVRVDESPQAAKRPVAQAKVEAPAAPAPARRVVVETPVPQPVLPSARRPTVRTAPTAARPTADREEPDGDSSGPGSGGSESDSSGSGSSASGSSGSGSGSSGSGSIGSDSSSSGSSGSSGSGSSGSGGSDSSGSGSSGSGTSDTSGSGSSVSGGSDSSGSGSGSDSSGSGSGDSGSGDTSSGSGSGDSGSGGDSGGVDDDDD